MLAMNLHVVNDLLDPATEGWNHRLLSQFFPAKLQSGYHVYISILLFVILVTEMLLRMIYSLANLRIGLHVRTYDWARGIWASVELDLLTNEAVDISIEDVLCATQE
ncbi:hypothetical protein Tco_0459881 [Tanacetum coccineum]